VSDPKGTDDKPAATPKTREREEQAAFTRTHNARESGRAARVKAAKDRKDGKK
jgi:hypothetical protein